MNSKGNTKENTEWDKQTLTQIPHPMHNSSEIKAILEAEVTSIHNFPADLQRERVRERNIHTY